MDETIDNTQGYSNGDDCPEGCGGSIEIRETVDGHLDGVDTIIYAQCTRCSWNTAP